MGLDIAVYKLLELVENPELEEDGCLVNEDDVIKLWKHPRFPKQFDDLVDEGVYKYEQLYDFVVGGYPNYTTYRDTLAKLANYKPVIDNDPSSKLHPFFYGAHYVKEGPFREQIVFSDCEGVIGSKTSKKLAEDYAKYIDKAAAIGDRFFEIYLEFKKAFDLARHDGVVKFH